MHNWLIQYQGSSFTSEMCYGSPKKLSYLPGSNWTKITTRTSYPDRSIPIVQKLGTNHNVNCVEFLNSLRTKCSHMCGMWLWNWCLQSSAWMLVLCCSCNCVFAALWMLWHESNSMIAAVQILWLECCIYSRECCDKWSIQLFPWFDRFLPVKSLNPIFSQQDAGFSIWNFVPYWEHCYIIIFDDEQVYLSFKSPFSRTRELQQTLKPKP